ncbi:MAG: TatD family hydrolase [Bacteroidetes bacterium]|nr:TatD family hydrolase [Bacteroidota bacterium]
MTWIDTHAHIYLPEFDTDRQAVLARCREAGITKIYMPNIDHTSIDAMLKLESDETACVAMMGLHPCSVKKDFEKELYRVEDWINKRKFAALGEIGTDLYWDKTLWPQQQEAFKIQVQWAKQRNLPVVIHCRESIDQTIELLKPLADKKLTGIFHCFSGNADQAKKIIELNFFLGIGGVVTFKNSGLDKVLPEVEAQYFVLETDSPYLAPVPHRGKRNEPGYIPLIAQKIAELKKISLEQLSEITNRNSEKIFSML